ncbi:MAG: bifunctional phosphopantothenoylcysteine decarboxylase/phosphopantothenate--cysteine ligase CoaBC [Chitinophagia bacterium]|nr:bifunctional phosphopantothenoylcysteine decarboxylase/phosphopantothenate--cysteine ligase CoaBC [Chitinophagia bacterium]
MLEGKKILLGVTGSIAAYKSAMLVRLLIKAGAEVKVILTPAAKEFVSPLTLSTLSRNPVLMDLVNEDTWQNHVALGRWADIMLIAPLSCNTLSKMASGTCDNLLMAVYLSATCKVAVAPAMDEDMWLHPATKRNLQIINNFENIVLPVDSGELASGLIGEGRMMEPAAMADWLKNHFSEGMPLSGKKVLITAGPTYEPIDPVRFIGNHSSGKMGLAIALELEKRGAEVTLIIGPNSLDIPDYIKTIKVQTAAEMFEVCKDLFPDVDIAVMSAAVADFTPVISAQEKIKKSDADLSIAFTKTKDILKYLGENKKLNQFLIGFALETSDEENYAKKKLIEKNADLIVLNSLNDEGAGFGYDTNKITIFNKLGDAQYFDTKSKKEVAVDIVNSIIQLL